MAKADLIASMAIESGRKKILCEKIINSFIKNIVNTLKEGKQVKIQKFGSFKVMDRGGIKGRNPKTGEEVIIDSFKIIKFQASKEFKDTFNE